jgi:aspartyl-tRNA(Asn)/glutamyl-tRNA(Gln) amidotransferase subunit A
MKSWFDWSPFTYPFNFTMQPAATVPCGLTRAGLPVAIQVVTARYRENLAFRAARAYESIRPFPMPGVSRLGRPARGSAR